MKNKNLSICLWTINILIFLFIFSMVVEGVDINWRGFVERMETKPNKIEEGFEEVCWYGKYFRIDKNEKELFVCNTDIQERSLSILYDKNKKEIVVGSRKCIWEGKIRYLFNTTSKINVNEREHPYHCEMEK